jgi:ABC-type transporter Mla subunit MlaD
MKVGTVEQVKPDLDNRRMLYKVKLYDDRFVLHTDGTASVRSGILGGAMLALTDLGDPDKPLANTPETAIKLSGGLEQAIDNLSKATMTVSKELDTDNPDSLLVGIKDVVTNLQTASEKIAAMMTDLRPEFDPKTSDTIAANLKTTMANLASSTTTIDKYVQKDFGEILHKVREISTSILATANSLKAITGNVDTLMAGNYDNIDEMIENMTLVSANLKAASKEIRRNPWRLLQQPTEKKLKTTDIYDAARAFDSGATQLDAAVSKLKALQAMDRDDPAVQKQIEAARTHLMESFKQFQKVEQRLWEELQKASE